MLAPAAIRVLAAALAAGWALPALGEEPDVFGVTLRGITYSAARSGSSELVLHADQAELLPGRGEVALRGVRVQLGRVVAVGEALAGLELSCAEGTLSLDTRGFVASGEVHGRTPDGREFQTERVAYDPERGRVWSDAPVLVREPAGTLLAQGFEYRVREGSFRMTGGASVVPSG